MYHDYEEFILSMLQDLLIWESRIAELKFRNVRTKVVKRTLPFKEGWLISIKAVILFISEFFTNNDEISFVLTRRLNQDPLEVKNDNIQCLYNSCTRIIISKNGLYNNLNALNDTLFQHLFSIIRGRGGFNDHPTVRQATGALRAIAGNSFLKRFSVQKVESENNNFTSPVEEAVIQTSVDDEDSDNEQVIEPDENADEISVNINDFSDPEALTWIFSTPDKLLCLR